MGGIISRKRKVWVWKNCRWGIKGLIMISKGVKQENSRAACRCMIVMWWLAIMHFDWDTCASCLNGTCISEGWNGITWVKMLSHVPPWEPCPAGLLKEQWLVIRPVASCTQHSIICYAGNQNYGTGFLPSLQTRPHMRGLKPFCKI